MEASLSHTYPKDFLLRTFTITLAVGFLWGLSGCAPADQPGPQVEVRDSAGIRIVENTGGRASEEGWSVDPEPLVSIGTFAGDSLQQLYEVQGALRLSDGRIAIANAGSGEIRIYDATGDFVGRHGRKGEGPGEFQGPTLVGVLGADSLVVADQQLRRISFIHPDHGYLGSVPFSDDIGGGGYPRGLFRDGSMVMGGGFYWSSDSGDQLTSGYARRATAYWSVGMDGGLRADYGEFAGSEFYMKVQTQAGGGVSMSARLIPFGKYAMQAVGPDRFYYASGDAWEVRAFDPEGDLSTIIRADLEPSPVRGEDLEARIQEEIDASSDPNMAQDIRADFEAMPVPDSYPAFASLFADALGYLWVEEYRGPGEETPTFDILDPEGALVGRVNLPPVSEILEIGEDYLVGLFRDELEIEYVRVYALGRPSRD